MHKYAFKIYIQMGIWRATIPSSVIELENKTWYFLWNLLLSRFCWVIKKKPKFKWCVIKLLVVPGSKNQLNELTLIFRADIIITNWKQKENEESRQPKQTYNPKTIYADKSKHPLDPDGIPSNLLANVIHDFV